MVECGLVADTDQAALTMHCDAMGRFEAVTRALKEQGLTDKTPQGYTVQHALFQIRNKLRDQVMRSAVEFGLAPVARARVKAPAQQSLPFGD